MNGIGIGIGMDTRMISSYSSLFSSSSAPRPPNNSSSFVLFPTSKAQSVTVCASSNNNNNKNKNKKKHKNDSHSFIPKPDEATGPFPEAVLLKQKKVEKDGELFPEFADDDEERVYQILKLQLQDDFEDERLRHYEVVYLIHEKHADEVQLLNDKIQAFLGEKRGKIWRISDWGMRRLAYKIQKAKNAHYFLMNFEMDAKWINDFKMMLDKDERVIRHLVMKRDEAITKDCPPPPEFHSLRAGIDDDEELDVDYEEDMDYDDENDIEDEGDITFVDEDEADEDDSTNDATGTTRINKTRAEKVAR